MPANVKIIHSKEFIRAKPDGQADMETAEALLKSIAEAGQGLEEFEVLVDTRRVSGALSATDLWSLAEKLVKYRKSFARRTAILCPLGKFDRGRFFAMCAANRGFNIHVFTSYEEAM